VGKQALVTRLQMLFQSGRLVLPLAEADEFVRELNTYEVRIAEDDAAVSVGGGAGAAVSR